MADINETPQEGINEYDAGMTGGDETAAFLNFLQSQDADRSRTIDQFGAQRRAQQINALQQEQLGLGDAPESVDARGARGSIMDPQDLFTVVGGVGGAFFGPGGAVAGTALGSALAETTGSTSQLQTSLKGGAGMLIESTGDTYEFLKAVVTPWDPDVDQSTTIGDFLQREGQELQMANTTFVPDELKSVGWNQLANPRFWATDVAKLLPYSMSFFLPAGAAARSTRLLLNSNRAYKTFRGVGAGEKLYRPVVKTAGKKQAQKRGIQAGEKYIDNELRKVPSIITGSLSGGLGGNWAEGAYVAGETMQAALADGLSPQEAQAAAQQVWSDNTNWWAADVAQFGLVFGGLGRLARGLGGLTKRISFSQKITPFIQATATGSLEGLMEQHQEVYQEWIKHKAIAERGGGDPLPYSEFLKQVVSGTSIGDVFGYQEDSEFREFYKDEKNLQTRISAFALGSVMGARGGYVDAIAEREYQLQESERRLGDAMDNAKFGRAQEMRKEIIAYTVIDQNGDASTAKSRVQRMVAEGQMEESVGQELIQAIEQGEEIYASTHKGNLLTQEAKRSIFLSRFDIKNFEADIDAINKDREDEIALARENNPEGGQELEETIERINREYDEAIAPIQEDIQNKKDFIRNVSSVKLGKLTKDKSRVKRSSVGLTQDQFKDFTTEGRKAEQEKLGVISQAATAVTEGVTKAAKATTSFVQDVVKNVRERGAKQAAQDVIKSESAKKITEFLKSQIEKGTNFSKKYIDKVIPGASNKIEEEVKSYRESLGDRVPTAEEVKKKAKEIIDKIKKSDLKGATTDVVNEIRDFVETKLKDKTVKETLLQSLQAAKTTGKSFLNQIKEKASKIDDKLKQRKANVIINKMDKGEALTEDENKFVDENQNLFTVDAEVVETEEQAEEAQAEVIQPVTKKKSKKLVEKPTIDITPKSDESFIEKIQKFAKRAKGKNPNRKDTDARKPVQKYIERYDENDQFIRGYIRRGLEKKFPNVNITFTNQRVIEGFSGGASAVFFGSTALVNPQAALQTDLIHELSHPYYQSISGTPLQKRLNELLIKRRIITPGGNLERLIDNIQFNYPLLALYNFNGAEMTGGDVIAQLLEDRNRNIESPLNSLLDNIVEFAETGKTIEYKNAVQSLFTQLSKEGSAKRLEDEKQFGLLEEAFAYSNEDFNRQGGIENVIENTRDAKKYDSILKRMYKRIAGLASKEEAKEVMEKAIPEIGMMNYEQAMQYVQDNFSILNKDGDLKQNSYNKTANLKKAEFNTISKAGLFNIVQQKVAGEGLRDEEAVQRIAEELYALNGKKYDAQKRKKPFGVHTLEHDTLLRRIRSQVDRVSFKEYERVVNNLIDSVNKELSVSEKASAELTVSFKQFEEDIIEDNDQSNIFDRDEVLFGNTTSKFIQAYTLEESKKDSKNPVNVKSLLAELHALGLKTKKQDNFSFVVGVTSSSNPEVIRFVKYLKSKLKKDTYVDALLLEMSIDFANKKIETMKEVGFMRGDNGVTTWVPGVSLSTDEVRWVSSLTRDANNRLFTRTPENSQLRTNLINGFREGKNIGELLSEIYQDSGYWQYVDKSKLGSGNVYNYKNKRYSSLEELVNKNREDFVKLYRGRYSLQFTNGFDNLLSDLIVQSRAKNYITQVNDVAENPTLTINRENSLLNKNENYADLSKKDLVAYYRLMENLGFFDENKGFKNIYAEMLGDGSGLEHNISLLSGVFSTPEASKQEQRRNRKYVRMDSLELMLTDFNDFLYSMRRYKRGEVGYYDQAIAVFGAAKRRYYVKTPIAQTFEERQDLLKMAYNAGYNDKKYIDGADVNPFKIVLEDGEYSLKGMGKLLPKFEKEILRDNKQIKNNDLIKLTKDGKLDQKTRNIAKNYMLNYAINKFFAQEFFIGKHDQAESEIDYIKRADGAIKRHTPHDRNVPMEFIAFKDILDNEGNKETDGQAYVLPGDGDVIRKKFGSMRDIGNQFKHVYDYVETNNPNKNVFGKRTFAKFKIDEITPAMEKLDPRMKKIADVLRRRKKEIGAQTLTPGAEVTGERHDFIPVVSFKSGLKIYAPGENFIYDLNALSIDEINEQQNLIYNSIGSSETNLFDGWKGISGEGFGMQLELDKERHSFHMPSQLFGHHHINLEPQEQDVVRRMHQLAAEAMVGFEQQRNKGVLYKSDTTPEERERDIQNLVKLIGEEFFGNTSTSLAQYAPGLHPQLHNMVQQLASSRLVKFGSKAMFRGTIAYQTSPLGRNLRSYTKVSDLVDGAATQEYKNALNNLIDQGKNFVVSEAVIPATAKKDGVKVGDLVMGTRIPAHGKQSSVVFVIKGFMSEGIDGARSTIAIPSKVSQVIGADLDGDAIFLNFAHKGNIQGEQRVSADGTVGVVQTNILKDWQTKANELLDLNIQLLADIEVGSRRYNEITTPIDIEKTADEAVKSVEDFYGKKLTMDNQLTPMGDAQFFNDNVPAQNMIGTIASLQRVLNTMAGHNVGFMFGINIEGYDEVSSLTDKFDENKPAGSAFTVAELLNIVLDNAKYQYANKLGLTPNTVNQFTLLSRLGYSLKDVSIIMNHPIVKIYDKHRGDQSIMTTNNSNQAIANTLKEHFKMGRAQIKSTIKDFQKRSEVKVDISKLNKKDKFNEEALIELLYKLEKVSDEIFSIGKAMSVHKSIPQHGHDAQKLINTITENRKGSLLNPNTLTGLRSDPMVQHSIALLSQQVERQKGTTFMYTPEARQVIEYIEDIKKIKLDFGLYEHRKLIEDYYLMKVSEAIPTLNTNTKLADIYKEIEDYSKLPGDNFVKKNLLLSNIDGSPYYQFNISVNPNQINKFSTEDNIQQLRNEFTELPTNIKDALLRYDYIKNKLGFERKSLTPLFSKDYIRNKFAMLDELLQKEIGKSVSIDSKEVTDKANQLIVDHSNLFKQEEDKVQITQKKVDGMKGQTSFDPQSAAKLKLNKREFYQDHLSELNKPLSKNEYYRFLGYNPTAIENADAKIKQFFEDRFSRYLDSVASVQRKEDSLGDVESKSIEELYDLAQELQQTEDELASPRLLHKVHIAIGRKAMNKQAQKLADRTQKEFVVGNEDISAIRSWLGSNDMTSKRPEVQFMINEIQKQYREYVRQVKTLIDEIDTTDRMLIRSKRPLLSGVFNTRERYNIIYGKMIDESGNGISLVNRKNFLASNPSKQEIDFYNTYMRITGEFRKKLGKSGMGEFYIPHVQMGNLEALSARGFLGLYANYIGSTSSIDNIKIVGTNKDGKKVTQSFKFFKDLYLAEEGELKMKNGKKIKELDKLRRKAKKFAKLGIHEDGSEVVATKLEMDTLMEGGLFSRFNASRTVRAEELTSYNIADNLRQYVRSVTFVHGYKDFEGMNSMSTLVDGVIAINRQMGNKNTAAYLTEAWRDGFFRKQRRVSMFGPTFDKTTQFFVRWTALIHLGFSASVGVGNILAGKYQELRTKGGKQFILGEKRFWTSMTSDSWKGMDILKKYRVVEMTFSDVVGERDMLSKLEKWAFLPMELSERWIQGAAFLGELTQQEFDSGEVSEERVMEINSKIATMHGEGYTQLDQRRLSMYSLGVAAQQFKRWFITLAYNRLKEEDINRFGRKTIGSYRASYEFIRDMMQGEESLLEFRNKFNNLEQHRKDAIIATLRGMGLTAMLLLLGMASDEDDFYADNVRKLSNDALIFTDTKRFVNYTIPPASLSTVRNSMRFAKELATQEQYKRSGKFGDRGDLKARGTLRKILPFQDITEGLLER